MDKGRATAAAADDVGRGRMEGEEPLVQLRRMTGEAQPAGAMARSRIASCPSSSPVVLPRCAGLFFRCVRSSKTKLGGQPCSLTMCVLLPVLPFPFHPHSSTRQAYTRSPFCLLAMKNGSCRSCWWTSSRCALGKRLEHRAHVWECVTW